MNVEKVHLFLIHQFIRIIERITKNYFKTNCVNIQYFIGLEGGSEGLGDGYRSDSRSSVQGN